MRAEQERERVREVLESDIVFGRLKPRERLVEQDIMERLQTRRHVVRAALESLEQKGLVERRANRGAQVRDLQPVEVEELYFMRVLLHRAAAEMTVLPLPRDVMTELTTLQDAHEDAIARGDLPAAFRCNECFHALLYGACGNSALQEALQYYTERTNLVRSSAFRSLDSLRKSAGEHRDILRAAERGDKAGFVAAVLDHIVAAKRSYLQAETLV